MKAYVDDLRQAGIRPTARSLALPGAGYAELLLLVLLLFLLLPFRTDAVPMLVWDEARNATNALEMALGGNWLVPLYEGLPDHWNTKPPLLIWAVAGLLRLDLPPLLALRLPSTLAAMGTIALLWLFCRQVLRDRLAAFLAGLLLLCSILYIGPHVARTGDYDTLQSFFILAYVLAFWMALRPGTPHRAGWMLACGGAIVLAVLTKGVAGGLALPGMLAYAILRGELGNLLRDPRIWAITLGTLALCIGYYLTRELYDPGYLDAIWYNELDGRFTTALDGHAGGPFFYLWVLLRGFQPGLLLLPLVAFTLRRGGLGMQRGSAALLCLLTAGLMLLALSLTGTKLHWYAAPLLPLLALAAALGVADALGWLAARGDRPLLAGHGLLARLPRLAPALLALLLLAATGTALWRNQVRTPAWTTWPGMEQIWYGSVLEAARQDFPGEPVLALENGIRNAAGLVHYNPILRFYTLWEADRHGQRVQAAAAGEARLRSGQLVASCDPVARDWLRQHRPLRPLHETPQCLLGRVP